VICLFRRLSFHQDLLNRGARQWKLRELYFEPAEPRSPTSAHGLGSTALSGAESALRRLRIAGTQQNSDAIYFLFSACDIILFRMPFYE
jgi:hypothetical protein